MAGTTPSSAFVLHHLRLKSAAHRPRRRRRHPSGDAQSGGPLERRRVRGASPPAATFTTAPPLPPCIHQGTPLPSPFNPLHILATVYSCSSSSTRYTLHLTVPHKMHHTNLPSTPHPHTNDTQIIHTNETQHVLNPTTYQPHIAAAPTSLLHRSRCRTNTAVECLQNADLPLRWFLLNITPHSATRPPHYQISLHLQVHPSDTLQHPHSFTPNPLNILSSNNSYLYRHTYSKSTQSPQRCLGCGQTPPLTAIYYSRLTTAQVSPAARTQHSFTPCPSHTPPPHNLSHPLLFPRLIPCDLSHLPPSLANAAVFNPHAICSQYRSTMDTLAHNDFNPPQSELLHRPKLHLSDLTLYPCPFTPSPYNTPSPTHPSPSHHT